MTRPLTVVYQELAQLTPQSVVPDLNCLVAASAYQLLDYEDDKAELEVANYGTYGADNPVTPPVANVPTLTIPAPPGIVPGGWVVPADVRVVFDDAQVILTEGADGAVSLNDNLLTSAGATFETDGVQAGDLLIIDNPAGPATPNLRVTVRSVVSETTLRVTSVFTAANTGLNYRLERTVHDQTVASAFVQTPTFRASNQIVLLGGVTLPVDNIQRVVTYARVYVAYRAYRTDLQSTDSVNPNTAANEILTKIGKIDARNPLAALVFVATQNAGQAPIYFYGVESDDLVGYTKMRDALSSDKDTYAFVLGRPDLTVSAMLRNSNVALADPVQALATGVPQKWRVGIGAETLVEQQDVAAVSETGAAQQLSGAVPPGNKTVTITGLNLLTANAQPGDVITFSAASNTAFNGAHTIAHINAATEFELDSGLSVAAGPIGANYVVTRPSTGATVVAEVDNRARLTAASVTFYSRIAGVAAGARTIALVEDATTTNGIFSVVEVAGVSTIINGNFAGTVTAAQVIAALNTGAGVTTPFAGSVNIVATTSNSAAAQAAFAAAALSTGTAGVNSVTSAALDEIYVRLFDASASFVTDGVIPGDILEIPYVTDGSFPEEGDAGVRRFVVNEVHSEQLLEIVSTGSGAYINNTSTAENELPHGDDRTGQGITAGTLTYRVTRDLTLDQQVDTLVSMAQSLRSQRALLAWPDLLDVADLVDGSLPRNADGTAALAGPQGGAYLAAAIGGMTAGLPNHQGFSRIGIAGIRRLYHSQGYFTETQLTELSEGGWYVFVQDTPESLPYCIHQLTTDPSALETGEYSMVKNFDYLSKFYWRIIDAFIGVWNVNEETLGFLRQALDSGTEQLKSQRVARIGAPLNDASVLSLGVSTVSSDRVEIYMDLSRPRPLNNIGLHLIG